MSLSLYRANVIGVVAILACTNVFAQAPVATEKTPHSADSETSGEALSGFELFQQRMASENPEDRYLGMMDLVPRDLTQQERLDAVPMLVKQLDDPVPDMRSLAANTLIFMGPDAKAAVPRLIQQLGDQEVNEILEAVWVQVSKALGMIGMDALQPLLDAIPDSDRVTYYGILAAIAEIGEPASDKATPILLDQLRNGPENRRWATMFALSKMGDAAKPAIPDYIKQLDHENFNMKVIACRALAELGPDAKSAVPKLLEIIEHDKIISARTHATMCLAAIGPVEGVDSVEISKKVASEKNAFSQERGMISLGRLGRHAESASEFIEEIMKEDDFSQKPEAAEALWRVTGKPEKSLQVLTDLIDSKTYDARCLSALVAMGPAATAAADRIATKISDEDQGIRLLAVHALGAIGPAAKSHVGALRERIADSDRDVIYAIHAAVEAIEK